MVELQILKIEGVAILMVMDKKIKLSEISSLVDGINQYDLIEPFSYKTLDFLSCFSSKF